MLDCQLIPVILFRNRLSFSLVREALVMFEALVELHCLEVQLMYLSLAKDQDLVRVVCLPESTAKQVEPIRLAETGLKPVQLVIKVQMVLILGLFLFLGPVCFVAAQSFVVNSL
jgi:hypothetical protein